MKCTRRPFSLADVLAWAARLEPNHPGKWGPRWCSVHKAYHIALRFPKVFRGYPVIEHIETANSVFEKIDHLNGYRCAPHCPCGGQGGIVHWSTVTIQKQVA